jgi:hypothetical protein
MPLNLTDNLGPKIDMQSGRWIPNSDTYLEAQSASLSTRRFLTAQVSDLYLVRWWLHCTSGATVGRVIPRVDYFTYGTGAGQQVSMTGADMAVDALNISSSQWMMIRSASSDIFISTTVSQNGATPRFNLYCSISRPS